ncbi:probable cysteine desulfurase [Methanocella paludicola SANAE]|uniref:Cysteine desulfurase IscS n=1 Tax=Methanocella paludicola (strain DSM 17711 / JCM 13418 / NBRC 101707 / SANAE) TaxID=304371 RepID=D1YVK8_METPS|nr:cysteine desulfurase NifS [Methanocella paludicola]BAI60480.1 probable cysteine desulfurase [Methanocella paludicola SANAE]
MKRIYLDNSATTKVSPEVLDAMLPFFTENYGNPSSLHTMGQEANVAVQAAREQVAKAIGADAGEIIFTSCGTEADNLALVGTAYANRKKGDHIITSSVEHPAILRTCEYLEKEGFKVTYLPVDNYGMVSPASVEAAITPQTTLISVMAVNNEIGTIQPIKEIGNIAKDHKIYFHTDAVQGVGKIPLNVKNDNIDMLSLAGHKIHAPKGVGALYVKKGTRIQALIHGGGQERNMKSGTENVPGIVGLGKACEVGIRDFDKNVAHMTKLRNKLMEGILKIDHVHLNGHPTIRSPNNVNASFNFIEGESLVLFLDMAGIEASTGSACSSKNLKASHVLLACGMNPEEAHGSLRFTNSELNTGEEIDYVLETLPGIVDRLRAMSPLYKKAAKTVT